MAFKLVKSPTYEWEIKFQFPAETGCKYETVSFVAIFKRMSQKQLVDLQKNHAKDTSLIAELVVGWKHIEDADGETLEYSQDNLEMLCDEYPALGATLIQAYTDSFQSIVEKKLKRLA